MFHRFRTTNILCSLAVRSEKAFYYNLFNTIKSESHISGKITYFTRNKGGWTCSTKCEWIFVSLRPECLFLHYWGCNYFSVSFEMDLISFQIKCVHYHADLCGICIDFCFIIVELLAYLQALMVFLLCWGKECIWNRWASCVGSIKYCMRLEH